MLADVPALRRAPEPVRLCYSELTSRRADLCYTSRAFDCSPAPVTISRKALPTCQSSK